MSGLPKLNGRQVAKVGLSLKRAGRREYGGFLARV